MSVKEFESVKMARKAAEAELEYYNKMMAIKKANKMEEEPKKKLFIVETISTFKHTYVIEAEELEHAFDEVTMIDSSNEDDYFESAEQKHLGETIIGGRKISKKGFKKLLAQIEKDESGSHWMGEKLIRTIKYI